MKRHRIFQGAVGAASTFLILLIPNNAFGQILDFPTQASSTISPVLFDIQIDGSYTGGVANGEWSPANPLFFEAQQSTRPRPIGRFSDEKLNMEIFSRGLYGQIVGVPGVGPSNTAFDFYMIAAFTGRTQPFGPNEFVAGFWFPVINNGSLAIPPPPEVNVGDLFVLGLQVQTDSNSNFEFKVDVNGDHVSDGDAIDLLIIGAAAFGPSNMLTSPHLVVEFEMPIHVLPGFGDVNGSGMQDAGEVFPPGGLIGLYPATPERWTSSWVTDNGAPMNMSDSVISFDRFGVATNSSIIPEPSALTLAALALLGLLAHGHRRHRPQKPTTKPHDECQKLNWS